MPLVKVALVSTERTKEEYALALEAYASAGGAEALRVLHRPQGWALGHYYADWIGSTR